MLPCFMFANLCLPLHIHNHWAVLRVVSLRYSCMLPQAAGMVPSWHDYIDDELVVACWCPYFAAVLLSLLLLLLAVAGHVLAVSVRGWAALRIGCSAAVTCGEERPMRCDAHSITVSCPTKAFCWSSLLAVQGALLTWRCTGCVCGRGR